MALFMDLFASIGCIIVTISISHFFRELVRVKLPKEMLWRQLLLEFIAAFEMTSVAHECSVVLGTGGISLYAIFILSICYWRSHNWHDVSGAPCTFIEDWVTRRIGLSTVILAVLAQLAGGMMSFRYFTTLYWRIGLTDTHTARLHKGFQDCKSHISAQPIVATFVESFGLFVYLIFAKLIGRVKYLNGVAGLLNAFMATSLVILAFDISGGYFNPVLASSIQFGCSGSTLLEHIQVYWVAHTLGTAGACGFDQLLSRGSNTKGSIRKTENLPKLHKKTH